MAQAYGEEVKIPNEIVRAALEAIKSGLEPRTDIFYDYAYERVKGLKLN